MGSQVEVFNKSDLGFKTSQNQKMYVNFFIPKKEEKKAKRNKCSYSNTNGHLESHCFKKKENKGKR